MSTAREDLKNARTSPPVPETPPVENKPKFLCENQETVLEYSMLRPWIKDRLLKKKWALPVAIALLLAVVALFVAMWVLGGNSSETTDMMYSFHQ